VEVLCERFGIPLFVFREDIPALAKAHGANLEEEARRFRYASFSALVREGKTDFVATAHHMEDAAETVLFRLIRGSALSGMDIFPDHDGILRPLLSVTREEILCYLSENNLPHVEDETNRDEAYTRNLLRASVFPVLNYAVHGADRHLVSFARLAAEDDRYLESLAAQSLVTKDNEFLVPVALPDPLFSRACVLAMKRSGILTDYTARQVELIGRLRHLQNGKKISLPCRIEAAREGENVVFYHAAVPFAEEIPFGIGTYTIGGRILRIAEGKGKLRADLDCFPFDCVIRTRREGDVFVVFGGQKKTLKKFLTDRKIPARIGRTLPLIACGSEIYAVCGVEISDKVRVTEQTVREGSITLSDDEKELI